MLTVKISKLCSDGGKHTIATDGNGNYWCYMCAKKLTIEDAKKDSEMSDDSTHIRTELENVLLNYRSACVSYPNLTDKYFKVALTAVLALIDERGSIKCHECNAITKENYITRQEAYEKAKEVLEKYETTIGFYITDDVEENITLNSALRTAFGIKEDK